jgi:hypothetical protein
MLNLLNEFCQFVGLTPFQACVVIGMLVAGFYAKWTIQPHVDADSHDD